MSESQDTSARKRVLVCEDDASIHTLYRKIFDRLGCEVDIATDGRQGFQLAIEKDYDLVVTDIRMPGWDGIDAILKIENERPDLRFVVVSAYLRDVSDLIEGKHAVAAMIQKPFAVKEFEAKMREILALS